MIKTIMKTIIIKLNIDAIILINIWMLSRIFLSRSPL